MDFQENQPIYLQIMARVNDRILTGEWPEGERIPSVRELGIQFGVNPNTVMRAYEKLQEQQIIFNRRGIGFFTTPGAAARVGAEQRNRFLHEELPGLFAKMNLLNITPDELIRQYQQFHSKTDENKQ